MYQKKCKFPLKSIEFWKSLQLFHQVETYHRALQCAAGISENQIISTCCLLWNVSLDEVQSPFNNGTSQLRATVWSAKLSIYRYAVFSILVLYMRYCTILYNLLGRMHNFMSVLIWGMKQYQLILVLNTKQRAARGELSESPIVMRLMASEGFKWKSNTNGPNINLRGRRIKSFVPILSAPLWCFNFGPDIYVVSIQTTHGFICCISQLSINVHKAICPHVKTSNNSPISSFFLFFVFFYKTHHLFKASISLLNNLFMSLFSISCLSLGWQSPWATVAALISNLDSLRKTCHIRCVSTLVTFTALIIYMIYLTVRANSHWITADGSVVIYEEFYFW